MNYYAKFGYADDGITVTFPDIPEAITCGQTDKEAMASAKDVLLFAVEDYFEDGRKFPLARKGKEGETAVSVPASVYAKILLHNKALESGLSKAELSRKAGVRPPELQRILDVRHKTKIDTVGKVLDALGSPLQLSI